MNFEVTSMVKCVTNELAIVEDEMKLDGVLVKQHKRQPEELGCLHLQRNTEKNCIFYCEVYDA